GFVGYRAQGRPRRRRGATREGQTMTEQQMLAPVVTGKKVLWVYNLIENEQRDGSKKTIWSKVGKAYVNRDGSLNVTLDQIPLNGKCHIREDREQGEWKPRGALATRAEAEA